MKRYRQKHGSYLLNAEQRHRAKKIKEALIRAKKSQRWLAQKMEVSDACISRWVNEKEPISKEKLKQIISIFNKC